MTGGCVVPAERGVGVVRPFSQEFGRAVEAVTGFGFDVVSGTVDRYCGCSGVPGVAVALELRLGSECIDGVGWQVSEGLLADASFDGTFGVVDEVAFVEPVGVLDDPRVMLGLLPGRCVDPEVEGVDTPLEPVGDRVAGIGEALAHDERVACLARFGDELRGVGGRRRDLAIERSPTRVELREGGLLSHGGDAVE